MSIIMLSLHEELLLIALKDEKGTILFTSATVLPYTLLGAVLEELFLAKKIDYEDSKIVVLDKSSTGNKFFDKILQLLPDVNDSIKLKKTFIKLNKKVKDVKHKTIKHLVNKGVLKEENSKVLGVFSKKTYPTLNSQPEKELRKKIRNYILNEETPEERMSALIGLIQISQLLEDVFQQDEIEKVKIRVKSILERTNEGDAIPEKNARFIRDLNTIITEVTATGGSL